jgi:hypothetical protein
MGRLPREVQVCRNRQKEPAEARSFFSYPPLYSEQYGATQEVLVTQLLFCTDYLYENMTQETAMYGIHLGDSSSPECLDTLNSRAMSEEGHSAALF